MAAMKESIVVTGVSTGIGLGITKVLIKRGFRVFGSVRRQQDADKIRAEVGPDFIALLMDVTDKAAVKQAAEQVRLQLGGTTLKGLVNNAGVATPAPMIYMPLDEFRRQVEVNLISQVSVVQEFVDLLGADRTLKGKPGRIVNISSVGGKIGTPFLGAYTASKHGVEGMSEALRRELIIFGIDVIIVGPGAVATAIWGKSSEEDIRPYDGTEYAPMLRNLLKFMAGEEKKGLPPEKLGEAVADALTNKFPRVRYAVVPAKLKNWTIPGLLPKRMLDRLIGKQLGLVQAGKRKDT